jgi:hypothetical protein
MQMDPQTMEPQEGAEGAKIGSRALVKGAGLNSGWLVSLRFGWPVRSTAEGCGKGISVDAGGCFRSVRRVAGRNRRVANGCQFKHGSFDPGEFLKLISISF